MPEMGALLERWRMDEAEIRRRMHRAPTPREWQRWHVVWLLVQSLPRAATRGLDGRGGGPGIGTRCPYDWAMGQGICGGWLVFEQSGGSPLELDVEQRAELKSAVPELPSQAGIDLSNWNWKVVRRFVEEQFRLTPSASSCLNYPVSSTGQALHRLGFVLKRPKAVAQSRPSAARGFHGRVCGADDGGSTDGNQDILR